MIWRIAVVVLALVLGATMFRSCGRERELSKELQASVDSLAATRASDSLARAALRDSATAAKATADSLSERIRTAATSGTRIIVRYRDRATVDSAAGTVTLPRTAWDSLQIGIDSLQSALAQAERRDSVRLREIEFVTRRADNAEQRLKPLEDALARSVAEQKAGCRLAFRIPCPTRTQAFIAGVVITAVAVEGVRRIPNP